MASNKIRTFLTVLGMVIGISSVIIVFSAGEGIKSLILGQIESFGTDIIQTEIKVPAGKKGSVASEQQNVTAIAQGVQITTLTIEDIEDIKKISNVKDGYGAILGQEQLSYKNELKKGFVMGVSSSYIDIDKSKVDYGNFFTKSDEDSLAEVVVLGSKIKETLFGNEDPIGKFVKLRKSKFRVIGVMEERGAVMTMDFDNYVYVPLKTLQKKVMGINHLLYMVHQIDNLSLADATAENIREILRENHNISDPDRDDFRVTTMQEMMEMLDIITGAITILLLAIVIVSLVVGGVGIMNIMYVIVSERTSEIGLRKAVGAKYGDIIKQFLTESVLITLIGGIIGIILGIIFSWLIALVANSYGLDWDLKIPPKAFIVSLAFSFLFGILFGVYPARKAAKMDPIVALRKE